MRLITIASSLILLGLLPTSSHAEDCEDPCIDYSGSLDITGEWTAPGDKGVSNFITIDPGAELETATRLGSGVSVLSNIVAESVLDPPPGKNRAFSDVGVYLDVLQLQYDAEDFSLWAGKIHPAFGRAYDVALGFHGADIGENYELSERIGGGASYNFDAGGFSNIVQASLFTIDRTALSESLFSNRGRTTLADGGAGNTQGISSVALSLGGCMGAEFDSCFDDGQLGYQFALRYQKGGVGSAGDEFGLEGDINRTLDISDETSLKVFGEIAWLRNYDGTADEAVFVTATAALVDGQVTTSLTFAVQDTLAARGGNTQTYIADAEVLYDLGDNVLLAGEDWTVGLGYTFSHEDGVNSHYVGLTLETAFEGTMPLHR